MKSQGIKFNQGKAPIHMIPEEAIIGMAKAFGYGAKKYDRFNYRKGLPYTALLDSYYRHALAYAMGEDIDEESGMPHTWCMLANAAMLEYMRVNWPELDDRYLSRRKKNASKSKKASSRSSNSKVRKARRRRS